MLIHEIIRSMFAGYKEANGGRKQREWEFRHLEQSEMLYGSDFLWEKYHEAESEEQLYNIIHHMTRHRTGGIESYDKVYFATYKRLQKLEDERLKQQGS